MTRMELFNGLCAVTDALQGIARALAEANAPQQYALEVQVQKLDSLIDACLDARTSPAGDELPSPCPHCGQGRCEVGATEEGHI